MLSIDEPTKPVYNLKIEHQLVAMLLGAGLTQAQIHLFFGEQVEAMLQVPHNIKIYKKPIWVMRGFFPDTPIFFKLSLLKNTTDQDYYDGQYYAKATIPPYRTGKRRPAHIVLSSHYLRPALLTQSMESEILGGTCGIEPPPNQPTVKIFQCMSPKGVKLHTLKKKRKKCRRATS